MTANEDYIRESIISPRSKLVRGFQPIMPTFQGQVSEEQLLQLLTYIKSLSPAASSGIETTAPARSNNPQTGPPPRSHWCKRDDAQRSNPWGATPRHRERPRAEVYPAGGSRPATPPTR